MHIFLFPLSLSLSLLLMVEQPTLSNCEHTWIRLHFFNARCSFPSSLLSPATSAQLGQQEAIKAHQRHNETQLDASCVDWWDQYGPAARARSASLDSDTASGVVGGQSVVGLVKSIGMTLVECCCGLRRFHLGKHFPFPISPPKPTLATTITTKPLWLLHKFQTLSQPADRQTDRQTDGQTHARTQRVSLSRFRFSGILGVSSLSTFLWKSQVR